MKRLLVIGLAFAALTSANLAHAQSASNSDAPSLPTFLTPSAPTVQEPTLTQNADGTYAVSGTNDNAAGQGNINNATNAFGPILGWIMVAFAWLAGMAGIILNDAVYYTVVQMGSVVNPSSLSAIGIAWKALRDIGNIILIFGFLAIGISTIVGYDNYGVGKRLPMLLIVAIFINFSLFATEAVIDVGNLFATEFYTQINNGQTPGVQGFSFANAVNGGISGTIMGSLGATTIFNVQQNGGSWFTDSKVALVGILGILLFLVLAFVLLSLAFVLIARFVILVFLMIIAPIGFVGLIVPGLESNAKKWWGTLFEQTVTAPALLLLLYVALAVITDAHFLTGFGVGNGASFAAVGDASPTALNSIAGLLLSFIIAMGMLLATVVLSKRMGAFGASAATKWAGAASFGATAWGMRVTAGGASNLLLRNRYVQRAASGVKADGKTPRGIVSTLAARTAVFTGDRIANRTFDARQTAGVGAGLRALGIDAGKASTTTAGESAKNVAEMAKTYKPFSGSWWRDRQKQYETAASELERNSKTSAGSKVEDIKGEFKKMSTDQIAELRGIRNGVDNFVEALSPEQYKKLQESDKLLRGEKDNLRKAWEDQFAEGKVKNTFARLTPEEVTSLGGKILSKPHVANELSVGRFNEIQRSGKISAAEKKDVREAWEARFTPEKFKSLTVDDVASLSGNVLSRDDIAELLDPSQLEALRRKGNLTVEQRKAIGQRLSGSSGPKKAAFDEYLSGEKDRDGSRAKYWKP